ncbi:hypothetical protein OAP18_02485 [Gammaproteobacteria bacterium]|nr:hypothetical protein [Gammaproteobacteria bacterium]
MQNILIGIAVLIASGIIIAIVGHWKGWWEKTKAPESIELATRAASFLDGKATERTTRLINISKKLGNGLILSYKSESPMDGEIEHEATLMANELLVSLKALVSKLSSADPELEPLKRAVVTYQKALEWRKQIFRNLCHPANPGSIDPGHIRTQLLAENNKLLDLLNAAKGECAIFLTGYGIGWFKRKRHYRQINKKQRKLYQDAVEKEYRSVLQQAALSKKA